MDSYVQSTLGNRLLDNWELLNAESTWDQPRDRRNFLLRAWSKLIAFPSYRVARSGVEKTSVTLNIRYSILRLQEEAV